MRLFYTQIFYEVANGNWIYETNFYPFFRIGKTSVWINAPNRFLNCKIKPLSPNLTSIWRWFDSSDVTNITNHPIKPAFNVFASCWVQKSNGTTWTGRIEIFCICAHFLRPIFPIFSKESFFKDRTLPLFLQEFHKFHSFFPSSYMQMRFGVYSLHLWIGLRHKKATWGFA